ncbi:MAG: ANTAR domain-containing protein [Eubacterium sp.]|nr:ANTAR domain-containing protein [Eubacterium sp.]
MAKRSDKQYSILIVSSSEQFNTVARKVLPNGKFNVVETKKSISAAKRELITRPYDLILVNAPLTDGFGTQFVMEVRERRSMGIIIAVPGEVYGDISDKLADQGIIAIAKPIVTKNLEVQIRLLLAMLENVKEAERKVTRIEEKMEEVRLVSRAKLVLIQKGMSEEEAHDYIIKQAMNTGQTKKSVAEDILD